MRDIFQLLEILIQLIAKRVELLNRVRVDNLPFKYFLRTAMSPAAMLDALVLCIDETLVNPFDATVHERSVDAGSGSTGTSR
jgi:hypothetical protein